MCTQTPHERLYPAQDSGAGAARPLLHSLIAAVCLVLFFSCVPDLMITVFGLTAGIVGCAALVSKHASKATAVPTKRSAPSGPRPQGALPPFPAGSTWPPPKAPSDLIPVPLPEAVTPTFSLPALVSSDEAIEGGLQPEELKTVSVRWLSGLSTDIRVAPKASVRELRQKVGKLKSMPACRVKLLSGTSVLHDDAQVDAIDETGIHGMLVDGWQAVSASYDHTLRVWDLIAGTCSGELAGHTDRVSGLSADFICQRAVSASWDSTLRVWDIEKKCCLGVLEGHTDSVSAVAADFIRNVAASGAWDATIRIWNLEHLECLAVLDGHLDRIVAVDADFALGRALSRSDDGVLKVWNLPGGCRATIDGHEGWLTATYVDLKQQRSLTGAFDGSVKLWDLESAKLITDLEGHTSGVNSICADFVRGLAVTGGTDSIRVWDLNSVTCTIHLVDRGELIHVLAVDFSDLRAVTGAAGGKVELWDLASGTHTSAQESHGSLVNAVSADFVRQRAVTCSTDGTLRAWDLEQMGPLGEGVMRGHGRAVVALCAG